jgi:xanthine dehydrogenase accessory factor
MSIIQRTVELLAAGQTFCLATVAASDNEAVPAGLKALIREDGSLEQATGNSTLDALLSGTALEVFASRKRQTREVLPGVLVYFDILFQKTRLVVCGAGHIAIPLARFSRDAGFDVTVIDDREDFASPERFPGCEVIARDFIPALRSLVMNRATYAVVITRGHEHDAECLAEILKHETGYVGLIGSRRRVGFVLEMLARQGIERSRLDEVFTPIGIPIGAESPEEIAVSIAAELICMRRKGPQQARALKDSVRGLQ